MSFPFLWQQAASVVPNISTTFCESLCRQELAALAQLWNVLEFAKCVHHLSQVSTMLCPHVTHNPLWLCRLKDTCGSLSSVLLYFAFFLPTTINTAWVSVAAGVGVLIVPEQYNWDERTVEGLAVVLIVLVTALGELLSSYLPILLKEHGPHMVLMSENKPSFLYPCSLTLLH